MLRCANAMLRYRCVLEAAHAGTHKGFQRLPGSPKNVTAFTEVFWRNSTDTDADMPYYMESAPTRKAKP